MIKNLQSNDNNLGGIGVAKIVVYKCSLKPSRNFQAIRLSGKQP